MHYARVARTGKLVAEDNLDVRPNPVKGWSGRECRTCEAASNRRRNDKRSAARAARKARLTA